MVSINLYNNGLLHLSLFTLFLLLIFQGDCKNAIHLWEPASETTWNVDSKPFVGHIASVEDLQVPLLIRPGNV